MIFNDKLINFNPNITNTSQLSLINNIGASNNIVGSNSYKSQYNKLEYM